VKVQLKQPPLTIKPGLSTQADIFTGSRTQVLAVPIQALVVKDLKPRPGRRSSRASPGRRGRVRHGGRKAVFRP